MANTDYRNGNLTILDMVYARLPFLNSADAATNTMVKNFVLEVMHELEGCFKVGVDDATKVGQEQYYTVTQQSIIADVVAIYILLRTVAANAQGTAGQAAQNTRYLKRAKSGTSEVEWGQFSIKEGMTMFTNVDNMINLYKKDAARKAKGLGCILDVCEDCVPIDGSGAMLPFLTISNCGCS